MFWWGEISEWSGFVVEVELEPPGDEYGGRLIFQLKVRADWSKAPSGGRRTKHWARLKYKTRARFE